MKTASVRNKLNLAGERQRQTQAFVDLTEASSSKFLVLKLPNIKRFVTYLVPVTYLEIQIN